MLLHRTLSLTPHQQLLRIIRFALMTKSWYILCEGLHYHSSVYRSFNLIQWAVVTRKSYVRRDRYYSGVSAVPSFPGGQEGGSLHSELLLSAFPIWGGTAYHRCSLSRFHICLCSRVSEVERSPESRCQLGRAWPGTAQARRAGPTCHTWSICGGPARESSNSDQG